MQNIQEEGAEPEKNKKCEECRKRSKHIILVEMENMQLNVLLSNLQLRIQSFDLSLFKTLMLFFPLLKACLMIFHKFI